MTEPTPEMIRAGVSKMPLRGIHTPGELAAVYIAMKALDPDFARPSPKNPIYPMNSPIYRRMG